MVYTPTSDDEYVVPLDLGVEPEPNAPYTALLAGTRTFLTFFTSADIELGIQEEIAIVEWKHCTVAVLGYPNEEAIEGHRLWGKGVKNLYFGETGSFPFEVINSSWVAAKERANRVHPRHHPSLFAKDRHFIVLFRDETFECIAHDFHTERTRESRSAVLARLTAEL